MTSTPSDPAVSSPLVRQGRTATILRPYLSVVVPVWNAANRLPATVYALSGVLEAQPYQSELILVDDHSDAATEYALRSIRCRVPMRAFRNTRNRGKGFSVARGMLAARGDLRVFTDADLAYSALGIEAIVDALERKHDVAIACRVLRESRYLMSPDFFPYLFTRHILSRGYNAVVRAALVPGVLDTQAGLKGFTAGAADAVFPRVRIPGFGFDVETLFVAQRHGLTVRQTAVNFRYDREPSTVRFLQAAGTMAGDLFRIKLNGWRGRYA